MSQQIGQPVTALIYQLITLLENLSDEQYVRKISLLSKASLGQHTRHVIEFFLELEKGYNTGIVNYDSRERDRAIETKRHFAIETLLYINAGIEKPDKLMTLKTDYESENSISTSYHRELLYAMDHTVHHMALLRIGVTIITNLSLPEDFGVAASTIKYRNQCAQ
ncbi:MAG: DinB family protein [Chitinophagaceae bacterium]|nr:DinB family protein [Chitinophagaceae bacterium]